MQQQQNLRLKVKNRLNYCNLVYFLLFMIISYNFAACHINVSAAFVFATKWQHVCPQKHKS